MIYPSCCRISSNDKTRFTHRSNQNTSSMVLFKGNPLVNVYIANWQITKFIAGKLTISEAKFDPIMAIINIIIFRCTLWQFNIIESGPLNIELFHPKRWFSMVFPSKMVVFYCFPIKNCEFPLFSHQKWWCSTVAVVLLEGKSHKIPWNHHKHPMKPPFSYSFPEGPGSH